MELVLAVWNSMHDDHNLLFTVGETLQLSYAADLCDEPQAHEAHLSDDPRDTRVKTRPLLLEKQTLRPRCITVPLPSSVEHREYHTVTVQSNQICPVSRVIRYA